MSLSISLASERERLRACVTVFGLKSEEGAGKHFLSGFSAPFGVFHYSLLSVVDKHCYG